MELSRRHRGPSKLQQCNDPLWEKQVTCQWQAATAVADGWLASRVEPGISAGGASVLPWRHCSEVISFEMTLLGSQRAGPRLGLDVYQPCWLECGISFICCMRAATHTCIHCSADRSVGCLSHT